MPTGSFQQYVIGFTLMVVAILTGIIMSWVGGQIMDGFYANSLNGVPLVPASLIAYAQSPFYTATSGLPEINYFVNLFYALCYFLPILGVLLFWQSFVKVQSAEAYGMIGYSGMSGGGGNQRLRRRRNR